MSISRASWIGGVLLLGATTISASSHAGTSMDIRRGDKVIAKGNDESASGSSMWCMKGDNGAGLIPYYFTKSRDFKNDVKVYERVGVGTNVHVYTIKPTGEVLQANNGVRRGKVEYVVSNAGTTYKATFRDDKGNSKGYAYWSPASAGFYDMNDKKIGSFGSGADGDMRFLAFFYFFLAPTACE